MGVNSVPQATLGFGVGSLTRTAESLVGDRFGLRISDLSRPRLRKVFTSASRRRPSREPRVDDAEGLGWFPLKEAALNLVVEAALAVGCWTRCWRELDLGRRFSPRSGWRLACEAEGEFVLSDPAETIESIRWTLLAPGGAFPAGELSLALVV